MNNPRIVSIYLDCEEEIRLQRMLKRNDPFVEAQKRIVNDRIAFYDKNLNGVTFVIDSSQDNFEQLGDKIYNLYHNLLVSLD